MSAFLKSKQKPSLSKVIQVKDDNKPNPSPTRSITRKAPMKNAAPSLITKSNPKPPQTPPRHPALLASASSPQRPKLIPPHIKSTPTKLNPPTPSPRRSLIPSSPSLHTKLLLTRLLPPELTLHILSLAGLHHRTAFTRTRQPIAYRERQVHTPQRIAQLVPPTLHLLAPGSSVMGPGAHPLRRVRVFLRFCPARLPGASVRFEARLVRGGRVVRGSVPLGGEVAMDGKVQGRMVDIGGEQGVEGAELVKRAKVGDRVGVWVVGHGGLFGDWLHVPGHEMRVLVEVREVSIECFCEW